MSRGTHIVDLVGARHPVVEENEAVIAVVAVVAVIAVVPTLAGAEVSVASEAPTEALGRTITTRVTSNSIIASRQSLVRAVENKNKKQLKIKAVTLMIVDTREIQSIKAKPEMQIDRFLTQRQSVSSELH
jgi:hypothetical protein